jgi:hypothetical protein
MKIRILQSIAGHAEPRYGLADFSFPPGAVVDVQEDLAKAWIASKIALAADGRDKLTMPVEVYRLEPEKPAQGDLQVTEA